MDWLSDFFVLIGEAEGDIGWAEMSVRALIVFIYGVIATRLGAWRAFGRWSPPDIIVAIIIGSNLSRALTGPAPLIPTLVASTVLIAAYWLLSLAASRSHWLDWLFKGSPVPIIVEGAVDRSALRRAVLSQRDVDEALREKGVAQSSRVITALLERNGRITVIREQDVK